MPLRLLSSATPPSIVFCRRGCTCECSPLEASALDSEWLVLVRVGQNRIHTPYMTVYLVISLPKFPYIHRIYMVLANPVYLPLSEHNLPVFTCDESFRAMWYGYQAKLNGVEISWSVALRSCCIHMR